MLAPFWNFALAAILEAITGGALRTSWEFRAGRTFQLLETVYAISKALPAATASAVPPTAGLWKDTGCIASLSPLVEMTTTSWCAIEDSAWPPRSRTTVADGESQCVLSVKHMHCDWDENIGLRSL
eukprot:GHVN01081119.1.p3 GENE.GHVN01081119.1~~GHVN01081119.1.p3  ORF type:complete len:126 (+),score=8.48 GHVN01081119.1:1743-2120(+)